MKSSFVDIMLGFMLGILVSIAGGAIMFHRAAPALVSRCLESEQER